MSNRRTSWEDNTTKVQIIAGLGIALQVISLILALAVKVKLWAWMGTSFAVNKVPGELLEKSHTECYVNG